MCVQLNDPWGDKSCYGMRCCWNNYNETVTARPLPDCHVALSLRASPLPGCHVAPPTAAMAHRASSENCSPIR